MSDFSLQYEGVIVPPAVEAEGALAVIDYVKAAPNAPADPAIRAALDADAAQHEVRYPQRAAKEKQAREAKRSAAAAANAALTLDAGAGDAPAAVKKEPK